MRGGPVHFVRVHLKNIIMKNQNQQALHIMEHFHYNNSQELHDKIVDLLSNEENLQDAVLIAVKERLEENDTEPAANDEPGTPSLPKCAEILAQIGINQPGKKLCERIDKAILRRITWSQIRKAHAEVCDGRGLIGATKPKKSLSTKQTESQ